MLGRGRWVALVVLALVCAAPAALAGSRGNPETVDAKGDTVDSNTFRSVNAPSADAVALWFKENPDTFEVHVRVADLAVPTGTNALKYTVRWDSAGETWLSDIEVLSDGVAAQLNTDPVQGTGFPEVATGTVSVRTEPAKDEVVATYPRAFTMTRLGSPMQVRFGPGTTFEDLRVLVSTGTGRSSTPRLYTQVDDTAPGSAFTFDGPLAPNPNLFLQPTTPVLPVARGTTASVPLAAFSPTGLDLGTTLTVAASRPDWTVEDATKELALGADGKATGAVRVKVPQFAAPGEACLVTVSGGAFPVSALLVVDDLDAVETARAALAPPPLTTDLVVRPWTLYLQGNTAPGSGGPLAPGRLVGAAPTGASSDVVTASRATVLPLGQWKSEPFAAGANLTGDARVDAWVSWSATQDVKLRALVGPAPLPLDWDGRRALPGVLALEPTSTVDSAASPVQLSATGRFPGPVTLGAGDRLAVALYVEIGQAQGTASLHVYGRETPTRLTLGVAEPALPRPTPGVVPSAGAAAFRITLAPPAGAAGLADVAAKVEGPSGSETLPVAAVPVDVRLGPAQGTTASKRLETTPFSPQFDVGREHVHAFDVAAASKRVEVRLAGPSTGDPTTDNDLDLVVRRADGVVVRASRAEGPVETVTLGPEVLARYGPGAYEAVVRLDRAVSATSLSYTLDVVEQDAVTQKSARYAGAALWSFAGKPVGDHTLVLARAGGPEETVSTVYRLTEIGPTLAPTAEFSYAPLSPVSGQPVNFTDLSIDADGRLARWSWDFGDGTTSDARDPAHAFARPGAYPVRLTVADDFNATAVSVAHVVDVANAPPIAAFTADPPVGTAGQVVRFSDLSSDPDGNVSGRTWAFDDGTVLHEALVEHVFHVAGTYNVSLTVFDDPPSLPEGSRLVRAFVVVDPGASTGRPDADFEAPFNAVEGRPARFTDASSWAEGPLDRRWDFGDGGVSAENDPLHTFAAPGEYAVTLTVFPPGRQDLTASLTRIVRVAPASGLAAAFTVSPASPATSDVVTFTDTTTALQGDLTRRWDFGDGNVVTAAGPTATHVYARPGTFTVRLTVSDRDATEAWGERSVTVDRAALVATPAPASPRAGSLLHYKADYDKGTEHKEDYATTWQEDELSGALDTEYLSAPGAYAYGTSPATPTTVVWKGGAATVAAPAGATTTALGVEVARSKGAASARALAPASAALGARPVDLSALDAPPTVEDDLADGLFRIETVLEGGGIQVRRSTTVLDGALHADVRTLMVGRPGDPMRLATEVALAAPRGSWLATWDGDGVRALPVEGADNLTYDLGGRANRWFAVYDPSTKDVAGVVASGDVTSVTLLRRGSDVVVRIDHVGVGQVLAAEYLVAYEVADAYATRYAGVMEVARQDDEEIGVAVLGDGRAAAVAWAGGRADLGVEVSSGIGALWDRVNGLPSTWTLTLDAPSADDGKAMRVVLPGTVLRDGGVRVLLDGDALPPGAYAAAADDGTLVLTVPIQHFSRHELTIQSVVPGLPKPFLWLGLAFGTVVGGGAFLAGQQMRSRAATRALGGEPGPATAPFGPRSNAVARVLGELDTPEAQAMRRALLQKLGEEQRSTERARYARCSNCASPLRYGPGETAMTCPRCGAENVHVPGGDT